MKKRQVLTMVSIVVISFLIGTTFNVMTMATDGGNPFDAIWEAICELQSTVDSLDASVIELQSVAATLEADLASLNASLIELEARINSIEEKLGQVRTSYVSVPASAFHPRDHAIEWALIYNTHFGDYLMPYSSNAQWFAPIQLPNNTTVTRFTYYFLDSYNLGDTEAKLIRSNFAGTRNIMATVSVDGTPGTSSGYDDTIDFASIGNSQFTYYVYVFTGLASPSGELGFYGVTIEYEYQAEMK